MAKDPEIYTNQIINDGDRGLIERMIRVRMNDRDVDDGWLVLLIQTRLMFPVFVLMRTGTEIEYEIPNSKLGGRVLVK